jgi:hypothetical protein
MGSDAPLARRPPSEPCRQIASRGGRIPVVLRWAARAFLRALASAALAPRARGAGRRAARFGWFLAGGQRVPAGAWFPCSLPLPQKQFKVKQKIADAVEDAGAPVAYNCRMVNRSLSHLIPQIGEGRRPHLYIDEWMQKRGLNDEKIALRIGVARETIWRWRKEQHRLNPGKMAALANALDLEPEDLWRPPERASVDAILRNVDDELHQTAVDIVQRLVRRA